MDRTAVETKDSPVDPHFRGKRRRGIVPRCSGNVGRYSRVLNCASENGLSLVRSGTIHAQDFGSEGWATKEAPVHSLPCAYHLCDSGPAISWFRPSPNACPAFCLL